MMPEIPHPLQRPQICSETVKARLEGLHNIYRDGVCAEYLWGYCATGNIVTPLDRHRFGIVLPEWDASQVSFRKCWPVTPDREIVLVACEKLMERWLREISSGIATKSIDHISDIVSAKTDLVKST